MPIRFHLDENVSTQISAGLRRRRIEVTTAVEQHLIGVPDEEQLRFAAEEGRVMVTHDADFLRLHALGVVHAGIAYCRPQSAPLGEILRRLLLLSELLSAEEMCGRVEFL